VSLLCRLLQNRDRLIDLAVKYCYPTFKLFFWLAIKVIKIKYKDIKIGCLYYQRIGHLSLNTDLFLRRQQLGIVDQETLFIFLVFRGRNNTNNYVANEHLLKMFKRKLHIVDGCLIPRLIRDYTINTPMWYGLLPFDSNEVFEYQNAKPCVSFTKQEEEQGKALLESVGIGTNDWFVCIMNKDDAYYNRFYSGVDCDHHAFRYTDIDTFVKASELIIQSGGWVFRMGNATAKKIAFSHPRFIEFTESKIFSAFMDIYLFATAKFVLADNLGGISPAFLFDNHCAIVNMHPPCCLHATKNTIHIPMKIFSDESKTFLSAEEACSKIQWPDSLFAQEYEKRGLRVVPNSEEEIYDLTREMLERLCGKFEYNQDDLKQQEHYHKITSKLGYSKESRSPIGRDFLRNNHWFLGYKHDE